MIDSWDKVTYAQFLDLRPGQDTATVLSILFGKPVDQVRKMNLDLDTTLQKLSFISEPIPQKNVGKEDLEKEAVGRYEDMRLYTNQFKEVVDFELFPVIFATYMQKEYDSDTVDDLIPQVKAMPCGEVLGTVNHYLKEQERIDQKWTDAFPKIAYKADEVNSGFKALGDFFGFAHTLFYVESQCPYKRDELVKWSVAEFKYYLLYLARKSEATEKYSLAQAAKVTAQRGKTRGR